MHFNYLSMIHSYLFNKLFLKRVLKRGLKKFNKTVRKNIYLLLISFVFFCFSIFTFAGNNRASLSNQEWANQKQKELLSIKNSKDYLDAKSFVENLRQKAQAKARNNQHAVDWAKEQLLSQHKFRQKSRQKIHQSDADLKNAIRKTKTGINIDSLLAQYANKMPSPYNLLNKKLNKKTSDLLIFVSFSMPKQSLKLWLRQAKAAGGVLVIRGLVNNSFKETAKVIREILKNDKGGFEINPIAFNKYKIKAVPAVIVQSDLPHGMTACFVKEKGPQRCDGELDSYDIVYGNVSLQRSLEEISRKGSVANNKADLILQRMRNLS